MNITRHNVNNTLMKYCFDWQLDSSFALEVDSTTKQWLKGGRQEARRRQRRRKEEEEGTITCCFESTSVRLRNKTNISSWMCLLRFCDLVDFGTFTGVPDGTNWKTNLFLWGTESKNAESRSRLCFSSKSTINESTCISHPVKSKARLLCSSVWCVNFYLTCAWMHDVVGLFLLQRGQMRKGGEKLSQHVWLKNVVTKGQATELKVDNVLKSSSLTKIKTNIRSESRAGASWQR